MNKFERLFWECLMALGAMCMVLQLVVLVVNIIELDPGDFAVAWFFFIVAFLLFGMARGELKNR